ncbi:hypothetical protein A4D02_02565 [Niastella koreensis]|uniref:Uncharacterized protein n=2 Tax=Niastella koreensis TaxID=354356 RepID=G8TIN7_NIAKG|nr:hypothetical protein [Niastella koreensis]AEW02890.1 hypothetical protein Niako_6666 [Niastella koreensis GR20-10]OQP55215.1 hypothetical protein A4D02_02565 [Niastella koreensis]
MSFNCYHIRTADFNSPGGGQGVVITRDNYEVFFVMYIDDELNAIEREAVDQFVQQNPDLEEELVMLHQSVLRPDDSIVFEQKENLFRHSKDTINEENCEEYFVLYGDDELTNEEKDKVEQFVYKHPQYQADFELIQQVKLVPDNSLSFPDKTYLYRTEEDDARVIAFPWWRFAAAAVTLLIIGGGAFYLSTHFNAGKGGIVVAKPTKPVKVILPAPLNSSDDKMEVPVIHKAEPANDDQALAKKTIRKNISKPGNIQSALYVQQEKKQQPEVDPAGENENSLSPRSVVMVKKLYDKPEVEGTGINNTVSNLIAANTITVQPDEEGNNTPVTSANKTPLRGFLRKVSRVVEKVTSPDDDGKASIRIANLEFAVK